MEERIKEIEKTFPNNPELIRLFQQYERDIRRYQYVCWEKGTTKELLEEKMRVLWDLAQRIDQVDLMILYYAQAIEGLGRARLFRALKARYRAQCAFQKDILGKNTFFDISNIGKKERKTKKIPDFGIK